MVQDPIDAPIYFDFLGWFMISYSLTWAIVLNVIVVTAALLFIVIALFLYAHRSGTVCFVQLGFSLINSNLQSIFRRHKAECFRRVRHYGCRSNCYDRIGRRRCNCVGHPVRCCGAFNELVLESMVTVRHLPVSIFLCTRSGIGHVSVVSAQGNLKAYTEFAEQKLSCSNAAACSVLGIGMHWHSVDGPNGQIGVHCHDVCGLLHGVTDH